MKENRALTQSFVTGGLGFVGRHLAERLAQRGDDVEVGDIHAQPALEVAGSYVQADVTNLDSLRTAFANKDVVFHVASKTGVWGHSFALGCVSRRWAR